MNGTRSNCSKLTILYFDSLCNFNELVAQLERSGPGSPHQRVLTSSLAPPGKEEPALPSTPDGNDSIGERITCHE